ncbi:MAG: pyruvate-flavodoxin oxidoreductase [Desulfitibacter sp. BRH_c19]|nr:MAG: pyruvate-flavodoxin oxidoreductase [Desulfitibacter sp. BRH_c19]
MTKIMKTMDGNTAAAYVSYAMTEVAAIYPITPSSNMAEVVDEWSAAGKKNIFGQEVLVSELQSEAGAAGAVHGSLSAGGLTTTFTASQGLLLMIPNMYKIAGELLPGVFHVSARALAGHALSIFGDHSDVMACRQTGFAMLASGSVQEVMDLGGIAHLAAIKSRVPFMHFFDGFRTSHEVQKIEAIDYQVFENLIDRAALKEFRDRAINPEHPVLKGTAQNPDIFFQAKEASNKFYEAVPDIVNEYMKEISEVTGREYKPFNYYGAPDAELIYIAMGSACEALEETIDYLVAKGEKVGMIKVHLYRPFSPKYFFDVLPKSVKRIAVLDRCKEPGSLGEPLYEDVRTMFYGMENAPMVIGGRYGLGSKDVTPSQLKAVFDNLKLEKPKNGFTIGIVDDVTRLSLPETEKLCIADEGTTRCKFWGFGSDGTVGANKDAIKIIGDHTDMYAQGYFAYDSKKSGGVTVSHLRFGKKPIRATYLIDEADYVACHKQAYVDQYEVLEGLKEGGTFLLNCNWTLEELEEKLPSNMKKYIAEKKIEFYIINAVDIAGAIGLGGRINMVMQSAFFKLANVIPYDDAVKYMKEAIKKTYGRKGEKIVSMNYQAVDKATEALRKVDVPAQWSNIAESEAAATTDIPEFISKVVAPMNRQQGDKLPVSTFVGSEDGTFPQGTSEYEKRGIAILVPEWQMENCIQCNQCSLVCPHAVVRPFLLDEKEAANAPESFVSKKAVGKQLAGLTYRIQVSPYDCTGCGSCANVCPAKTKALVMKPVEEQISLQEDNWNYAMENVSIKDHLLDLATIKGSQFAQPLLQFSGACGGCGETPYVKLVTQLFGDRMMIANATGCSSIWGGSAPNMPYCKNKEGKGPAWANSLFEDNAEFGYGMALAVKKIREKLGMLMEEAIGQDISDDLKAAFQEWIVGQDSAKGSTEATSKIMPLLAANINNSAVKEIDERSDFLNKKSQWIFGGDGWAYDIGYGGLDHIISTGEDVNILVLDTEVYSNTGGQSSKATPVGAMAKFAAAGKRTRKKDLGLIATTYGEVYVAQIAMGANMNQTIKVLAEAEAYPGPSLIIAYAPCINHTIKGGLAKAMEEMKNAVNAGYWHLWRYNPLLKEEGKNPFILESKEPTVSYQDFLKSEGRYTTLVQAFPEIAEALFEKAAKDSKERYESYKRMAMECK